jgi:hypothetical protein
VYQKPDFVFFVDIKKPDPVFDTGSFMQLHGPSPHALVKTSS